jgi:hypothetical protein
MYSRHCRPRASYDILRATSLVSRFILLLVLPALVMLHEPLVMAQTTSSVGTADSQDAPSLTTAQEQARQLATALTTGKREATVVPENLPALGLLADQTMRLGKRLVIPLFAWHGIEIRFVGGEQTFASPVDEASTTAPEDTGRPSFLPASQAAMGVEVTGERASVSPSAK